MMVQYPGLLQQCPLCGGMVASNAPACPHCGYRPAGAAPATHSINVAALTLGLGGVLIAVGTFLPWVTVTSFISVSRSGIDLGSDGIITLTIGMIIVLVAAVSFSDSGLGGLERILGLLGGAAAVAIAVIDAADLAHRIAGLSSSALAIGSIGVGLYVVAIGAGTAVLVALLGGRQ